MVDKIYENGEVVFAKGEESRFAYVIRDGEVEILEGYPDRPIRLALLKKDAVFGEMGLVDERPRLLTARAVTKTRVHQIDREGFVLMIRNDPDEALQYLRMFFERLRAMNVRVARAEEAPADHDEQPHALTVSLLPKTDPAARVVGSDGLVIEDFPFRVGRDTGRLNDPFNVNELTLPDSSPYYVSRNHFSIDRDVNGYYIHDRGSYLGTIVNNTVIGGHHQGAHLKLKEGDNHLIVGSRHSPYGFTVRLEPNVPE